jgi:hypothetical protein
VSEDNSDPRLLQSQAKPIASVAMGKYGSGHPVREYDSRSTETTRLRSECPLPAGRIGIAVDWMGGVSVESRRSMVESIGGSCGLPLHDVGVGHTGAG